MQLLQIQLLNLEKHHWDKLIFLIHVQKEPFCFSRPIRSFPWQSDCFLQTVKELEKAIVSSPLGLNPKVDGERLIAAIPP